MRRRAIVVGAVIAAAVVVAVIARGRLFNSGEAPRYRTAEVTRGDLLLSVSASGTVEAVALVEVKSRATGQVRSVFVDEGTPVRTGQVLVEIDDPDARADVENARGALVAARANVAAARARLAQTQAGRPEEIAQAEEAVRQARASEALARQNLDRQEQLFKEGFIPRSALEQAQSQHEVAASQVKAAASRLAQVRAGGSVQDVEIARAQLAQAEAQQAQAAANLRQAVDRLAESRITAPIDGVVVKRSVAVGWSVIGSATGGTPVVTLAQMTPVQVTVYVDEADITRVTLQARVEVTADALPGVVLAGRSARVAPQPIVDQNVTKYPVTIEVDDPKRLLRLGMTVDAEFVLARRTGVLLVPQEAVRGQESKAVFVVESGALKPRVVETGLSDGRFVEIRAGLREGELVYLGTVRSNGPTAPPGGSPFQPRVPPRR